MKLQKKAQSVPGIAELPKPDPSRAGAYKTVILAVLAVLFVGGAAFWLTRDEDTRLRWREEAAGVIDDATEGTPLAGAGSFLREAPPPPPPAVVNPPTLPGTLAGQTVQGAVGGGPADAPAASGSGTAGVPRGEAAPVAGRNDAAQGDGPQVMPRVTEDSRVRPDVVEDLAAWVVSRYKRGPQGGSLNVSVQSLNQRYGVKLAAASGGRGGGRDALLRYAFQPTMLRGLYGLYADRFLEAVNHEAAAKGFTPEQTGQLRTALAGRAALLAGALEGVASVSDLPARLNAVDKAAQGVVDVNAQLADAVFDLDRLREDKASAAQLSTASLRVEGLTARYRRALDSQAVAERSLVAAVRQGGGLSLDDDTLLFLAQWVGRRLKTDAQALASVRASASVLRDLARRSTQPVAARSRELSTPRASGGADGASPAPTPSTPAPPSASPAASAAPAPETPVPAPSEQPKLPPSTGALTPPASPAEQLTPPPAASPMPKAVPALPSPPAPRPAEEAAR